MNFTLFYLLFLLAASGYRISRLRKTKKAPRKKGSLHHKGFFTLMLICYLLVMISTIVEYFVLPKRVNYIVTLAGVLLYAGVIPLRRWAIDSLGKYMSEDIEIRPDHQLIEEGPYKYLSHPLLFCLFLEVVGFTLVPNSYHSLGLALVFYLPLILLRKRLEEKALIAKFGQRYLEYKRRTVLGRLLGRKTG